MDVNVINLRKLTPNTKEGTLILGVGWIGGLLERGGGARGGVAT